MEVCHPLKSSDNRNRIQTSSRRIIRALKIWRIFIPLMIGLVWIFFNHLPPQMQHEIVSDSVRLPLPLSNRLLGFVIAMIPGGITMYGLTILIRLFSLYQHGKIFHTDNVHCLQLLSRVLITLCFVGILTDTLMGIALTLHHPQGERILAIGIESPDITALIVGYILATIARVMQEACRLQEEQDLTV